MTCSPSFRSHYKFATDPLTAMRLCYDETSNLTAHSTLKGQGSHNLNPSDDGLRFRHKDSTLRVRTSHLKSVPYLLSGRGIAQLTNEGYKTRTVERRCNSYVKR
jgi:hypothetical protein